MVRSILMLALCCFLLGALVMIAGVTHEFGTVLQVVVRANVHMFQVVQNGYIVLRGQLIEVRIHFTLLVVELLEVFEFLGANGFVWLA